MYEFLKATIQNPKYNPSLIHWVDQEKGDFKIVDSQKLAQLWGASRKGCKRTAGTYEHLSRAFRYDIVINLATA